MPPNWLVQWSPIIENLSTATAVLGGAVIALVGLTAWKKQLHGQANFDLARRVLRAAYKMRNALGHARNAWVLPAETEAAVKEAGLNEIDKGNQGKQEAAVYTVRWRKVADQYAEFQAELLEAEVAWGSSIVDEAKDLGERLKDLGLAFRQHVREFNERSNLTPEQRKENSLIVYSTSDRSGKDAFAMRVDDAVRRIENAIKPHLPR